MERNDAPMPPDPGDDDAKTEAVWEQLRETPVRTVIRLMVRMPPEDAAEVLARLTPEQRVEAIRGIVLAIHGVAPSQQAMEAALDAKVAETTGRPAGRFAGPAAAADLLNLCDRAVEKSVLADLCAISPDMAGELRKRLFVFDDLRILDERGIEALLLEVETDELALALKSAGKPLREKILSCLSDRAAQTLAEAMGRFRSPAVLVLEDAQQRIVDTALRMDREGGLVIPWRRVNWD